MKDYKPYIHWTKFELETHLVRQAIHYGLDHLEDRIREIVRDERWDPRMDFNGCSVVQDPTHPCLACFIHDFNWVVNHGGIEHDREFRELMILTGISKRMAWTRYFGVRLGWIFYYKWHYMIKRYKIKKRISHDSTQDNNAS